MQKEADTKDDEPVAAQRNIRRKPENPRANVKNFEAENARMGVKSEVDLILDSVKRAEARGKYSKNLVGFSSEKGTAVKRAKEPKFLTVQGLLDHPYFMSINEADISIVIDEFERLQQPIFND